MTISLSKLKQKHSADVEKSPEGSHKEQIRIKIGRSLPAPVQITTQSKSALSQQYSDASVPLFSPAALVFRAPVHEQDPHAENSFDEANQMQHHPYITS